MSTLTSGAKLKVTGLFKAAYRWLREESEPGSPKATPPPPATSQPPPKLPPPSPKTPTSRATPPAASNGDTLHLPLQPVLDALPAELKVRQRQQSVGAFTIPLPVSKILAQLPHGAVKIPFGELRLAAPGVFLLATDCDHMLVSLPLNEILKRINVTKLPRRPDQKVVEVSSDITSPFGENGKGIVISTATPKSPVPAPPSRAALPRVPTQPAAIQRGVTPASAPAPASATLPIAMPRSVAPGMPPKPATTVPLPKPTLSSVTAPPRPATPLDAPVLASPPKPVVGPSLSAPPHAPRSSLPVNPAATAPVSPAAAAPTTPAPAVSDRAADFLQVPLLTLMETWPQTVRLEIAQLNLIDAKVVVPVPVLEKGLRLGKVEFPWKLVRAWIRPEVPPQASANDAVALPFQLTVVAPLFVAQRKPAARQQRRVAVDATIPNLFFGFPQSEGSPGFANAAPVNAPAASRAPDTNFYAARDYEQERAQGEPPAVGTAPSTDFLRRYTSPNELVKRAVALEGVAGALVALPDGLAVASRVPPNLNGETLAAFLPQIFCKLSQCTQELRMGTLNNVNFTVGNVPWKIFRVNNVFFAAFGRAEESLPTAQLAALAAELDRKPKAD